MDESTIAFFSTQSRTRGKIGVLPHTPLATITPTSLACTREREHNIAWKWHTHTVLMCWLMIGVFSISHLRNDSNYESLISLRGPRQRSPLSINASVMRRLVSIRSPRHPYSFSDSTAGEPTMTAPTTNTARTLSHLLAIPFPACFLRTAA
jgi:hypothetical protein